MSTEEQKIAVENKGEEKDGNVVVIDFFAEWCGPCKMQDPIMEELKKKFDGKVEFKKVDVDEEMELSNKYNIHAVPTLIIEKDGKQFTKYVGVTNLKVLERKIEEALKWSWISMK